MGVNDGRAGCHSGLHVGCGHLQYAVRVEPHRHENLLLRGTIGRQPVHDDLPDPAAQPGVRVLPLQQRGPVLEHPPPRGVGAAEQAPVQLASAPADMNAAAEDSQTVISRLESEIPSVAVWSEPQNDTTVIWLPDQQQ